MSAANRAIRNSAATAAALAAVLLVGACREPEAASASVSVRDPEYLVVRPIRSERDAEYTIPVDLPYAGAGFGFASSQALLDLNSVELGSVAFAGGRTSIVGEATIWLPLKPEASRRLEAWSSEHTGDYLGIFLKGRLVAAPRIRSRIGGGIPLRVPSKSEGDVVLRELRAGGARE
jgi:hypothetical protein